MTEVRVSLMRSERGKNGIICTENAKALNPGDVVSARGFGKFDFEEQSGFSKKGKL